jgi:hypothetical protein
MAKELTDLERAIVMQVVLDRWNPDRLTLKISNHFDLTTNQVRNLRRKPAFQAEVSKQMAIYKGEFCGVQLADRKERLIALDQLYRKIPDVRVSLRLKVLTAIRHEVGDDELNVPSIEPQPAHLNIPPRAESYEEWIKQNRLAASG